MGLLDLYAAQAGSTDQPLQTLPRSLGERVEATAAEVFAPDRYFTITGARREAWQRTVDELHSATGQTFANPYGAVTPEEMMRLGNQPAIEVERRNKIIEAARAAREQNPDLFDPENIDRYIGEEANRRRQTAASFEGTGNGVLNFLAGAALETATPHGVVGLVVPVTRLPGAAASTVGRTFLGNVAREGAFQAGANAALQAGAEGLDYLSRSETGTEQTLGEVVTNIAGAAVIGGAIGGGIRALHLKWLGLPEEVRARAPLEVRDAFRVIEADSIYSGQNRLGVDPLLHERYQGRAMDAIMRGQPVDFSDLTRTADTPMTALGTILRQQTDRVEMTRLVGTPDEGLRDAFARTAALPTSEIEAFAREARPNSFARLDKVEAQLSEAAGRLAEIDSRAPSIADMVDPDTAMRLQDIERDLGAPGLRRQAREELEREREMIVRTVDPKDRLPREAAKAQRIEREAVQKEITRLEAQRVEARKTADAATADLQRKLGRYEELLSTPEAPQAMAKDLGYDAPASLGEAILRADTLRQARMVREIMPDEARPPVDIAEIRKTIGSTTAEPDPEMAAAVDKQATALLENRSALGNLKAAAIKELEAVDQQMKDAQVALNCAMGSL